jgi:hypothetical protein
LWVLQLTYAFLKLVWQKSTVRLDFAIHTIVPLLTVADYILHITENGCVYETKKITAQKLKLHYTNMINVRIVKKEKQEK